MIKQTICYSVVCDGCGKNFFDGDEYQMWDDEGYAIYVASEEGMHEIGGGHYCEDCCELNEETDEYVIIKK